MSKVNHITKIGLLTFGLAFVLLTPVRAYALEQNQFGGNNASDYQPPTGNPQSILPTSLQPTNTALQLGPNLNQQGLVQNSGLSVQTAPNGGATTTGAEPKVATKPKSALPIWIVGGLLTLTAVVYIVFKPDKEPASIQAGALPIEKKEQSLTQKAKASKKSGKKVSRKKRKTARK